MSSHERTITVVSEAMIRFADRTGLTSERPPQRYLWTDAFAVCNFLGLHRATGESRYLELALALVEQVHHVLGRHRADDSRGGWISGLPEEEGEAHPTRGGLRIGKKFPERAASEPFDESLEWDRDGQYFHYLTKWMHALDQLARATRDARYHLWSRELARAAYDAFVSGAVGRRRMAWKMSIDLSRRLVPTTGHHDPLDGFVTAVQIEATASLLGVPSVTSLDEAISDYAAMIHGRDLVTSDALGIGGLLTDAASLAQAIDQGSRDSVELLSTLLAAALEGLAIFAWSGELDRPAAHRLAFRELGLAIGLHALEPMTKAVHAYGESRAELEAQLAAFDRFGALARTIESFWLDPNAQRSRTWSEHRDIDEVMLATSLLPEGFVVLR